MQTATKILATIMERMPGERTALAVILKEGASAGLDPGDLLKDLVGAGLRISAADWASLLTSKALPEVQPVHRLSML